MADPPPGLGAGDDSGVGTDRERTRGAPRWVKVLGIVALLLALVFAILQFVVGGEHGPGRHGGDGDRPPAGVTEDGGHTPPPGIDHGGRQP